MKKRIIILFAFICGLAFSALGQGSAQATMRVSVKVVSGKSVKAVQPNVVLFNKSEANLGQLTLNGANRENSFVSFYKKVTLIDKEGNSIDMSVSTLQNDPQNQSKINFKGAISSRNTPPGIYTGNITTSVEYL